MSLKIALYLGLKNFTSKRRDRKALSHYMLSSVLGIALSLVPLFIVTEVSNGMIAGITSRYIEVATYHIQITCFKDFNSEELGNILGKINNSSGIINIFIERTGIGGIINSDRKQFGINIRALSPDIYKTDFGFRSYLKVLSGSFDLSSPYSILIGKSLADQLKMKVGDQIKIITFKFEQNKRLVPRPSAFRISGIYTTGYQELDKTTVLIPFETGKKILAFKNSREFFGIKVKDPFSAQLKETIKSIEKNIEDFDNLGRVRDWYEINENHYSAFQTTKTLLIIVMVLIVIVAVTNIFSSMVMIVMERMQEIGILKSIGMKPSTILLSFIVTGLLAGVVGTVLGEALGLLASININEVLSGIEYAINFLAGLIKTVLSPFYNLELNQPIRLLNPEFYLVVIPIRISFIEVFIISSFTLLLSVIASYFPAKMASNIKPLEVIRKY